MERTSLNNEKLDVYLESNTTKESKLLVELNHATKENFPNYHMLSGHVQGRFLSLISKMLQPEHILEIGTYTGYATLCLAEGLTENGKITTLDIDASLQEFHLPFFQKSKYKNQINPVITDAIEYLKNENETYDLIFLDANKRKYIEYFELLIPKMRKGSVILADNVLWKGKVLDKIQPNDKMTQALHDFNQHIIQDNRVEVVVLPLRDGISLIRKK